LIERDIDENVYDVFARSLKRSRVVITIDSRLFAKKKSRVDVQNRVSSKIAIDSNFVEKKKKKVKKKKKTTKKIAKKKKPKRMKKRERKMKMTKSTMMTKRTTTSMFESCKSLLTSNLKFRFLSSSISDRFVSSRSR
jgi:hypothetical protein